MNNAISLVSGADSPPLLDDTVGGALTRAAITWPDQEAVVCCESKARLTYAQLDTRAIEFAAGLLALNLQPGDRIGIWAPNCVEWTITQYAAAKAGFETAIALPGASAGSYVAVQALSGAGAVLSTSATLKISGQA